MVELNKYSYYALNSANLDTIDELNDFVNEITRLDSYSNVKKFLTNKWNNLDNAKIIDYPELNKNVYVSITDDRIEVRVFKNKQQCYGEYWQIS